MPRRPKCLVCLVRIAARILSAPFHSVKWSGVSAVHYLQTAQKSLRVIISHLHRPVDWDRPHRGAKPADVLCRSPERPRSLGCVRQSNTKVVQVKLVVLSAHNELVGTVSCEGADGYAQIEGGSSEPRNPLAELVQVSAQSRLP